MNGATQRLTWGVAEDIKIENADQTMSDDAQPVPKASPVVTSKATAQEGPVMEQTPHQLPSAPKTNWRKLSLAYRVGNVQVDCGKNAPTIACDCFPDMPMVEAESTAGLDQSDEEENDEYFDEFTDENEAADEYDLAGDDAEYQRIVSQVSEALTAEERNRIVWPKGNKKMSAKHKERAEILLEAKRVGDNREKNDDRRITIIYNPVSGGGKAKRIVAHLVEPVLQLAKVPYTVMATQ